MSEEALAAQMIESLFEDPMSACSKYESCNANICPLDPEWRLRTHLRGESSCHFLRLHVKHAATEDEVTTPAYLAAIELWKQKHLLPLELVNQLERSAQSGRRSIPIPQKIDPEKADAAMLRLQAIFGESRNKPINRFG